MDKKSAEELEEQLKELMTKDPLPNGDLVKLVEGAPSGKAKGLIAMALKGFEEKNDFNGAFNFVNSAQKAIAEALGQAAGMTVRETFRKLTKDNRLLLSFVEGVGFETRALKESVGRLGRLLSFTKGALVLSQAWGLGTVRDIDYFYRRVTVDFPTRHGHQFTYDAACETLVLAPEKHILVTQKGDPDRVAALIKDHPGEFVKEMLRSFGDMPVTILEEYCVQYGFIKPGKFVDEKNKTKDRWKAFWESARNELRQDKCVEIPTRRADPIHLKAKAEDYGEGWFTALSHIKDAKSILASVRELDAQQRYKDLDEEHRFKIAERLAFALKAARGVDDSLFARIAFCISDLKLDSLLASNEKLAFACSEKSRNYLWSAQLSGEARYLAAARSLPARETGALVAFLTGSESEEARNEAKTRLFAELPKMCFALLSETIEAYKNDPACEDVVAALLRDPNAPATLVTLLLGRYEMFAPWFGFDLLPVEEKAVNDKGEEVVVNTKMKLFCFTPEERQARNLTPPFSYKLPPFIVILTHAIVLGEGRQGGETLRMQNMVRRLFADEKWLNGILDLLRPADKALFFERFQASIAWDPSTHHLIVVRMTRHAPELAARVVKKIEAKKIERITSIRSYAERQLAYEKLTKEDIPANTRRIEFAKSYGDLSENAEYQYARDEQRALMQKESLLQKDLNEVKAVDFSDVFAPTEVVPGSVVVIATASGEEKTYTVLGEWDNDLERGIISNKTQLAANMLGKKPGDTFELSDAEGNISIATIKSVGALTDELRAWIAETPVVA